MATFPRLPEQKARYSKACEVLIRNTNNSDRNFIFTLT